MSILDKLVNRIKSNKKAILKRNSSYTYVEFIGSDGKPCQQAIAEYGTFIMQLPKSLNNYKLETIKFALEYELKNANKEYDIIIRE